MMSDFRTRIGQGVVLIAIALAGGCQQPAPPASPVPAPAAPAARPTELTGLRSAIRSLGNDGIASQMLTDAAEVEGALAQSDKGRAQTALTSLSRRAFEASIETVPLERATAVVAMAVKLQDLYDIPGVVTHRDSCATNTPPLRKCGPSKGLICYTISGVQGATGDSCP
jgi:hypothetical protein